MTTVPEVALSCPFPIAEYPRVLLAHGGGGTLMHQLIERMFLSVFANPWLGAQHDGAVLDLPAAPVAVTTDSYVVRPLVFPGGDIGHLAINGTVNDLAMCGARPLAVTVGFILEEGLPMELLWRVVRSMRSAADMAGVTVASGDTKVVDRGHGDGLFINTSGIGTVVSDQPVIPARVRPGDAVLLSGDLGRHGTAIMAVREGLAFESTIESDTAPVAGPVLALLDAGIDVHCLRDLTRGGMASALVEIAGTAGVHIALDERQIPVPPQVRGACEMLGLDPLYVANEGRFVAFLPAAEAERALAILRSHPVAAQAQLVGCVAEIEPGGLVTMTTEIGTSRIVDMLSGEQLPRIC